MVDKTVRFDEVYDRGTIWGLRLIGAYLSLASFGALYYLLDGFTIVTLAVSLTFVPSFVVILLIESVVRASSDGIRFEFEHGGDSPGWFVYTFTTSLMAWVLAIVIGIPLFVVSIFVNISVVLFSCVLGSTLLCMSVDWLLLTGEEISIIKETSTSDQSPATTDPHAGSADDTEQNGPVDGQQQLRSDLEEIRNDIEQTNLSSARNELDKVESKIEDLQNERTDTDSLESIKREVKYELQVEEVRRKYETAKEAIHNNNLDRAVGQIREAQESIEDTGEFVDRHDLDDNRLSEIEADVSSVADVRHFSEAKDAFELARQSLTNGEYEKVSSIAKEGIEACDKVKQVTTNKIAQINDLQSELEELRDEAETVRELVETARSHRNSAQTALEHESYDTAERELSKLCNVIDELSQYEEVKETEQLRAESKRIRQQITSIDETSNKQVDDLIESAESAKSRSIEHLQTGSFDKALESIESTKDLFDTAASLDEKFDLGRTSEIERKRDEFETIRNLLEEAKTRYNSTDRALRSHSYQTAESELSKLQHTIEKLEDTDALSGSLDQVRSEVTQFEDRIETARAEEKIADLIDSIELACSHAEESIDQHSYNRAITKLDSALETTVEASSLNENEGLGYKDRLKDKHEQVASLLDEVKHKVEERHRKRIELAEEAVARGIDRRESEAHSEAVEAFEEANEQYSEALELAETHDLPERWETAQRSSMVETYLELAREDYDGRKRSIRADLEQSLKRAESAVDRTEQYAEVEDYVSAYESLQEATRALDEVSNQLDIDEIAEQFHSRYDELTARRDSVEKRLPEESEIGSYRNQELVESLQLLAAKLGESPRPKFVNTYGEFPADAYLEAFGSWPEALAAANLDPIDEQARERRTYSRGEILEELERIAEQVGNPPSKSEMNRYGNISTATVRNRFEDWETALELAAVTPADNTEKQDTERSSSPASDKAKRAQEQNGDDTVATDDMQPSRNNETGTSHTARTLSDVPENTRWEDSVPVQILDIQSGHSENVDKTLNVEDADGNEAKMKMWEKHGIEVDWEINEVYHIAEFRITRWDKDGTERTSISSTSDFDVEPRYADADRKEESDPARSSGIMSEIENEFEDIQID